MITFLAEVFDARHNTFEKIMSEDSDIGQFYEDLIYNGYTVISIRPVAK